MRISLKQAYLVVGKKGEKEVKETVVGFPDAQELARFWCIDGWEVTMDEA